jgi:hypothetical protein
MLAPPPGMGYGCPVKKLPEFAGPGRYSPRITFGSCVNLHTRPAG